MSAAWAGVLLPDCFPKVSFTPIHVAWTWITDPTFAFDLLIFKLRVVFSRFDSWIKTEFVAAPDEIVDAYYTRRCGLRPPLFQPEGLATLAPALELDLHVSSVRWRP